MGRRDKAIRMLVADRDEALRADLRSLSHIGVAVEFSDARTLDEIQPQLDRHDVVVVSVASGLDLKLITDLCSLPAAPAVIALAEAGFEGKPLEHTLLLAEIRGASATLVKPLDAAELVKLSEKLAASRNGIPRGTPVKPVARGVERKPLLG